jgi:hypothetical protein
MAPPWLSTQPQHVSTGLVLVRQAPDPLHTFWTAPRPPSKSGAVERGQQKWDPVLRPAALQIIQ